ncbi:MAG TPA: hypothetical protein VM487_22000 [Phycisphaerae bacterium]|nr:hypothetical protein [Phycisphaerae bacterium]
MNLRNRIRELEAVVGRPDRRREAERVRADVRAILQCPEALARCSAFYERHGVGPHGPEALDAMAADPEAERLCELVTTG